MKAATMSAASIRTFSRLRICWAVLLARSPSELKPAKSTMDVLAIGASKAPNPGHISARNSLAAIAR